MLESIQINNFKSVQDLGIELGKINVFIGENGCGKTSILESIGLASAAVSDKLDQEFLVSRGIRVTDPRLMKSAFSAEHELEDIRLKLQTGKKFLDYRINYSNRNMRVSKVIEDEESEENKAWNAHFKEFTATDSYRSLQSERPGKLKDSPPDAQQIYITNLLRKFNDYLKNEKGTSSSELIAIEKQDAYRIFNIDKFLIYTPENYFLRRFEEEGQINPVGVRGEGLFRHLEEQFKNNPSFATDICSNLKLISWFEGLEIPSDLAFSEMSLNIKDKFIKETIDYFDQRSANEGFLYLLFYFTLFLSKETPDFFAIDNIDNSLNPKLCSELIKRLVFLSKARDKQVILTTHNPSILDGMDLLDDDQRLFVIFRNADGHTKAKRIKAPKPIKGVETVRLSEAFIRGYIGGLPKNF